MTDPVMLLSQVHGEGRVTFRALRAAGFNTIETVAHATLHTLSDRAHLSMQTARRLKAGAEEMLGRGIATTAPPAEPGNGARGRLVAGRNGRGRGRGEGAPLAAGGLLSTGVTLEEASLLGQGGRASWPAGLEAPPPAPAPPPASLPAGMAVAAEMAASLIRSSIEPRQEAPSGPPAAPAPTDDPSPAPSRPATVRGPSCWTFG